MHEVMLKVLGFETTWVGLLLLLHLLGVRRLHDQGRLVDE